jgi:hypothetical protein
MNTFTCEKCLRTFNKNRPDGEARQEFEQAPWNIPGDEIGVICYDCFQEFKVWFASLTPEDHKSIKGE